MARSTEKVQGKLMSSSSVNFDLQVLVVERLESQLVNFTMQQQSSPKRCDKMSKEWALIEMFTREMQTKHARVRTNFNTEELFGVRLG